MTNLRKPKRFDFAKIRDRNRYGKIKIGQRIGPCRRLRSGRGNLLGIAPPTVDTFRWRWPKFRSKKKFWWNWIRCWSFLKNRKIEKPKKLKRSETKIFNLKPKKWSWLMRKVTKVAKATKDKRVTLIRNVVFRNFRQFNQIWWKIAFWSPKINFRLKQLLNSDFRLKGL